MGFQSLRAEVEAMIKKLREWQTELGSVKDAAGAKAVRDKISDFESHTTKYYGIGKHIKESW